MAWTKLYDEAEPQRVNRWLAQSGICSRRDAEGLISNGLVSIDGEIVSDVGRKILPGQTLVLSDTASHQLASAVTVILHKPAGFVSANPEPDQEAAAWLLTAANQFGTPGAVPAPEPPLSPVGRLDRDSRGLLILSDDGVVAKAVIGPDSRMDKEYQVRVMGEITPEIIRQLRHGLWMDGRQLRPARVHRIGDDRLKFVLSEGRNRQIRRMCEQVGLRVIDLLRTRIGPLKLGDLAEGQWRSLSGEERQSLIEAAQE